MPLYSTERLSSGHSIEMKDSFKVSENSDGQHNHDVPNHGGDGEQWGDTPNDLRDMQRLGKKQEFK